jgi:Carboxypeptidase regulatory-like domain
MWNVKSYWHPLARLAALVSGAVLLLFSSLLLAQSTVSTGSIVGTVTDSTGAPVSAASVKITNRGTGNVISTTTTTTGTYGLGGLIPGQYQVKVEAKGSKSAQFSAEVQVGTMATANIKLEAGESSQVVNVTAAQVVVNVEQPTVQDVVTKTQIENLPINGRNFFDLGQLEPGVQLQDGGTFDPTKNGFSSVSFDGRFGRTAQIQLDGIDISDETVGTTTQNVPLGAIEEFGLQRSLLDLSTELTSSGSVNVSTGSGTNHLHGQGFYNFRDQSLNAALPGHSTNPFQRNQFGGSVGGAILKDRLFFFADAERTKQDLLQTVLPALPFTQLAGNFDSPFRETNGIGKLDWLVDRYRVFYRFTYDQNKSVLPFIPNSFQPFTNDNHARSHVVGVDFSSGNITHSIRAGYMKFENGIADAVTGSNIFNPAPGIELAIGSDPNCLTAGVNAFCSGPNYLAPQATMQSNEQIKYDGSRVYKDHILKFGGGYNHILGGGYAKFLGLAPAVNSPAITPPCVSAGNCPFPGGPANPLNYPAVFVTMGNGQGFSSEIPAFGLPGGGLGPDNRLSAYIGDAWKVKPTFTLTFGIRYVRDTGRTDSDLPPIPFLSEFDFSNQYYTYRGLENRVNQPNLNFAPQIGFAWDPEGKGKTVVRAGIGLFYENSIWNNSLFDRPARLQKGLFLGSEPACTASGPQSLSFATGINLSQVCGAPIGSVVSQIVTLQQEYQASVQAAGPTPNPGFIGTAGAAGANITGTSLLAPTYVSPRSVQMNFGVQREVRHGTVITIDFLRNVATHNLLAIDTNHVGDFRTFNLGNAQGAVAATLAACGVSSVSAAISSGACPAGPGGTTSSHTAQIYDFAANGLDSGYSLCGGFACPKAAFAGFNPSVGANQMLFPIGRSLYNGLQATLKQQVDDPMRGVKHLNFQASYSFSKYVSTARDSDFINSAYDNADPLKNIGPNGLDRTHQISFGGYADLVKDFQVSFIGHFDSPLPSDVRLPTSGFSGGIFQTDVTGDGTGDGSFASNGGLGDLLLGTKVGGFGRSFGPKGLNQAISTFNTAAVGQLTPAGQQVVSSGLITQSQMVALGGTIMGGTPLATAPAGAIGQNWLRTFDVGLKWNYKVKEYVKLQPGVTIFNLFNFSNFDGPAIPFNPVLNGSVGSANGTTSALLHGALGNPYRLGLGSGVNSLGAPRAIEFNLKLSF